MTATSGRPVTDALRRHRRRPGRDGQRHGLSAGQARRARARAGGVHARARAWLVGRPDAHHPARLLRASRRTCRCSRRRGQLWPEIEREADDHLLEVTGGLYIGRRGSDVLDGALLSARQHGLEHELLDADESRTAFPGTRRSTTTCRRSTSHSPGCSLRSAASQRTCGSRQRHGAELHFEERVTGWTLGRQERRSDRDHDAWHVPRGQARRFCRRVAAQADARAGESAARRSSATSRSGSSQRRSRRSSPPTDCPFGSSSSTRSTPSTAFRHSPSSRPRTASPPRPRRAPRSARHHGGERGRPGHGRSHGQRRGRARRCATSCAATCHCADGRRLDSRVCMYTNTPDENFVLGLDPRDDRVVIASPCSGHGFKFSNVVGQICADLALDGRTDFDIDFLSPARFRTADRHPGLARRGVAELHRTTFRPASHSGDERTTARIRTNHRRFGLPVEKWHG